MNVIACWTLVVSTAAAAGCTSAGSAVVRRGPPPDSVRIPILVYHNIAPHHPGQSRVQAELDVDTSTFREQMAYLAEQRFKVISFAAFVDALQGRTPVPEHAVVITFDDGWKTQYERAVPVLHQLGFTATFFVYIATIGPDPGFMTWDQVRELKQLGMTVGSHSVTHPFLTKLDAAALRTEVDSSRATIARNLGDSVDFFAYPYGAWNDAALAAVRTAGYRAARDIGGGAWNRPSDLFALHSVQATDDMEEFKRALEEQPVKSSGSR